MIRTLLMVGLSVAIGSVAAAAPVDQEPDDEEPVQAEPGQRSSETSSGSEASTKPNLARAAIDAGVQFSFRVGAAVPVGELADRSSAVGLDFGVDVAYAPAGWPIAFGLMFEGATVGGESPPTGNVFVTYDHDIVFVGGLVRLSPLRTRVRPYVDAYAGANQNQTNSRVTFLCQLLCPDPLLERIEEERVFSSFNAAYGGAVGLRVGLGGARANGEQMAGILWLDIRLAYAHADEAEYVVPGTIRESGGTLSYDTTTSSTDLVRATIGVTFGR